MRFKTSSLLASSFLVAGALGAGTQAANAWSAVTTANSNVRSGPGSGYSVLGSVPAGTPIEIVGCTGNWCQTQYGYVNARLLSQSGAVAGAPAYARGGTVYRQPVQSYVSPLQTQVGSNYVAAPPPVAYVPAAGGALSTAPAVVQGSVGGSSAAVADTATATTMAGPRTTIGVANVRSGPGVEYDVVKTLPDFTKVEVLGCANTWCQTSEGYISIFLLSRGPVKQVLNQAAEPRVPGSQTRDSLQGQGHLDGYAALGYASTPVMGRVAQAPAALPSYPATVARSYAPAAAVTPYPTSAYPSSPYPGSSYPATTYSPTAQQLPYASQASSTTTANLNVRSGPGLRYSVLGTLPAGSPVEISGCTRSWCQTQYGYVSARFVGRQGQMPAMRYNRAPVSSGYPPNSSIGTVRYSPAQAPRYLGAPGRSSAVTPSTGAGFEPIPAAYASTGTVSPYEQSGAPAGYATAPEYANYAAPSYSGGYAAPMAGAYAPAETYAQPAYLTAASLPVQDTLGGISSSWGGYGRGLGWTNWRTSWGPGYWGPALYGRNTMSNWGARPSYWGGRTTYWNVHPGYKTVARFGDRKGNTYWSRRGEGRLPQDSRWYYGLGPTWQGPYAEGPGYNGRPVVWRARSGV